MRKRILSVLFGLTLFLATVAVAFAEEYVVTITVDGKPVALSIVVDGDSLEVDSESPGVEVASIVTVATVATPVQTSEGTATANRDANLRSGPGTNHPIAGGVKKGQALTVIGSNPAGDWLQLSDNKWIAAFLVSDTPTPTATAPGPTTVPTPTPPASPTPTPTPTDTCVEPRIKGNISYNTGEKIYHVPGQQYYDDTVINTADGERWFCTEQEAQAAGWRKSQR